MATVPFVFMALFDSLFVRHFWAFLEILYLELWASLWLYFLSSSCNFLSNFYIPVSVMLKIEIGWKFMRFHFLSGIWENKWQRRVRFLTSNSVKLPVIRAHKPIVNLHLEQKIHTTRICLLHWIYLSSLESKTEKIYF